MASPQWLAGQRTATLETRGSVVDEAFRRHGYLKAPTTVEGLPVYRDWPRLLWGVAEMVDWLDDPRNAELDDYLRAGEARALVDRIGNTLTQAGVSVSRHGLAEEYWPSFVATVEDALGLLDVSAPSMKERLP